MSWLTLQFGSSIFSNHTDLRRLVIARKIWIHSAIIGELIVGNLPARAQTIADLYTLPRIIETPSDEVLELIERHKLYGKGLSWVDVQLLASAVNSNIPLWTADVRLQTAAQRFNLAWNP